MKAYWNCEAEELKKNFQVSEEGLLPAQVEAIRREKGENVLQEGKRKSVAAVFAQQFCDLLVVILFNMLQRTSFGYFGSGVMAVSAT